MYPDKILQSFGHELEKVAEESKEDRRRRYRRAGVGAALGATLVGSAVALSNPYVRASASNFLRTMERGGARAVDASSASPPEARRQAQQVYEHLVRQGVDPSKARVAVVGAGGTGDDAADPFVTGSPRGFWETGMYAQIVGNVAAADSDLFEAHEHLSRPGDRLIDVDDFPGAHIAQAGCLQRRILSVRSPFVLINSITASTSTPTFSGS